MHQHFERPWQLRGAGGDCISAVFGLLIAHGRNDRATTSIVGRQPVQVAVQVITNLPLGFCDEAETPFVADDATQCTHGERSGVPDRAKPTRPFTQLIETLFAPCEVIEFLICGLLHLRFDLTIARGNSMSLVETLCRDLAGVIDAHQSGGMRLLLCIEAGLIDIRRGVCTGGLAGRGRDGSQRIVDACNQSIEPCQIACLHTRDYTNDNARRFPKS